MVGALRVAWCVASVLSIVVVLFLAYPLVASDSLREPAFLLPADTLVVVGAAAKGYIPVDEKVDGVDVSRAVMSTRNHRLEARMHTIATKVKSVRVRHVHNEWTLDCWLIDGRLRTYRFDTAQVQLTIDSDPFNQ